MSGVQWFLLTGPSSVGKTTLAPKLAAKLNWDPAKSVLDSDAVWFDLRNRHPNRSKAWLDKQYLPEMVRIATENLTKRQNLIIVDNKPDIFNKLIKRFPSGQVLVVHRPLRVVLEMNKNRIDPRTLKGVANDWSRFFGAKGLVQRNCQWGLLRILD